MQVYELLEKYRIGNLKEEDAAEVAAKSSEGGLFANEPRRHKVSFACLQGLGIILIKLFFVQALQEVSKTPYNAETPLPILADKFNTPNDLFYVRNHLPTPDLKVRKRSCIFAIKTISFHNIACRPTITSLKFRYLVPERTGRCSSWTTSRSSPSTPSPRPYNAEGTGEGETKEM